MNFFIVYFKEAHFKVAADLTGIETKIQPILKLFDYFVNHIPDMGLASRI
jgi:hypothetical protein